MLFKNWDYEYLLECRYVFCNKAHNNFMLKVLELVSYLLQ